MKSLISQYYGKRERDRTVAARHIERGQAFDFLAGQLAAQSPGMCRRDALRDAERILDGGDDD